MPFIKTSDKRTIRTSKETSAGAHRFAHGERFRNRSPFAISRSARMGATPPSFAIIRARRTLSRTPFRNRWVI